ncbi:sodium channel subunit beta-2 isoform X1 [Puntigrus tetrazona]|uniref:sodium channel subunit beta-2 isoform X1 n=1 Tax=Puntigrus tetrazona TaxID=1606681 RepID=UPI001C892514|nr:sodium channel subunit beta-2 isoform X1 [Puntigrus tetrazona]
MYSVIKKKTNFTGSSCSVMRCLFIVFIFTVHGTYGCVKTSPDQKVKAGTDVHLSCNFSQCPGPLDIMSVSVEWEFMDISSEPKIILYYIRNRTVPLPGVFFKGDVKLGSFDIQLQSVTDKNNGTYLCRLRLNGIFHKNQTHLIVQSALTRRILPGVNRLQTPPLWWPSLASVAGLVLLIGTMFLGRKAYRSTQRENNSKQNIEVVNNSSHGEDKGVTYRVTHLRYLLLYVCSHFLSLLSVVVKSIESNFLWFKFRLRWDSACPTLRTRAVLPAVQITSMLPCMVSHWHQMLLSQLDAADSFLPIGSRRMTRNPYTSPATKIYHLKDETQNKRLFKLPVQ